MVGRETVCILEDNLCVWDVCLFSGNVLRLQTNLHCFFSSPLGIWV